MRNAGLEEAQAGIKIAKRNINNVRYADDTTLMAQSESPLDCKEIQPVHCSMSGSNCCFLTCIQVSQEIGKVVWYSYLFKNCPNCDPHSQRF